jgi:hypothetical protein
MTPKDKEESTLTIVIDNEEEDDWMKSLPGYRHEIELHERIAAELENERSD